MSSRVAWIVLGVALCLVGGRTLLAAQSALNPERDKGSKSVNNRQDNLVYEVSRGDSLIRSIGALPRSPFLAPPARVVPAEARRRPAEPATIPFETPKVVLIMEDANGNTVVQIDVNGDTSDRMSVGSTFRGWTIKKITDRGVVVTKGNSTFNLSRP